MNRGTEIKLRKCLSPQILGMLDQHTHIEGIELEELIILKYKRKWHDLKKIASRTLNYIIKENRNKVSKYNPAERFNVPNFYFGEIRNMWQNLWLIKNPMLRAVRLKILYKEIWTNEKRFRLYMVGDDKCVVCGETETVFHQLFVCKNARNLWEIVRALTGVKVPCCEQDFIDHIGVTSDYLTETLKSCVLNYYSVTISHFGS